MLKKLKSILKLGAVGAVAGASAAAYTSASFSRKEDAKRGAIIGAGAAALGSIVFRRIRGRIIPIRIK